MPEELDRCLRLQAAFDAVKGQCGNSLGKLCFRDARLDAERFHEDVSRTADGIGNVLESHVVEAVEAPRFHRSVLRQRLQVTKRNRSTLPWASEKVRLLRLSFSIRFPGGFLADEFLGEDAADVDDAGQDGLAVEEVSDGQKATLAEHEFAPFGHADGLEGVLPVALL
jgi:hypothetical protein